MAAFISIVHGCSMMLDSLQFFARSGNNGYGHGGDNGHGGYGPGVLESFLVSRRQSK
jgi:hypothetical protein